MGIDVSIFASSVRPHLWDDAFKNLSTNKCSYEVVFSGDLEEDIVKPYLDKYSFLKYIHTARIKPAQNYYVAWKNCSGVYCLWTADDAEYSDGLLDKCIEYHSSLKNFRAILSLKTNEDGKNNDLDDHRFFGNNKNTPLMAPIAFLNTKLVEVLGGFDRRIVAGQWENDFCMRNYSSGGITVKFEDVCVFIEHIKKHGKSTKFWTAYDHDRMILENTWCIGGYAPAEKIMTVFDQSRKPPFWNYIPVINREVSKKPLLPFEPYEDKDLLTKSQSHKGQWE